MEESGLDRWTTRLGSENVPVFARTIECVAGLANSENSSFSQLAWSILQDPSLTAQVLKLSNSIFYNPASKRIQTVSRAVMRLGFDTVRAICLSACLVETGLAGKHQERVALEIARAFHAAVQAKKLAGKRKLAHPEEVYVAALLSRIGQIAFWCFAGEMGDKLDEAMQEGGESEARVEMEVLGFRLERLTLRLTQEWKLSSLLESMLENPNSIHPDEQSVRLGYTLAHACEKGWESLEYKKVIRKISEFLKIDEDEAGQSVQTASKDAIDLTDTFGAKKSSRLIPLPAEPAKAQAPPPPKVEKVDYPKTNYQVQISSLRDLSTIVGTKRGDMNSVLSILLEGIYRGIGMDRVIFALLTSDRKFVIGKYALGWADEGGIQKFRVGINGSNNLFVHVLRNQKPLWVTEDPEPEIFSLLTKEISDPVGAGPFFVMPICIKGQSIGVVYTDRNLSGRDLDDESFESFSFFGQHANSSLTMLAGI